MQKLLGKNKIFLEHISYSERIKYITQKISKIKGLWRKFQPVLPSSSLLIYCRTFLRNQLGYDDIMTKDMITLFMKNWNYIQYNVRLAITDAVKGTSIEKVYQKLA